MSNFEEAARARRQGGFASEFWQFLRHSKKWWLLPIVVILAAFGLLMVLSGTAAAPFIYTLFYTNCPARQSSSTVEDNGRSSDCLLLVDRDDAEAGHARRERLARGDGHVRKVHVCSRSARVEDAVRPRRQPTHREGSLRCPPDDHDVWPSALTNATGSNDGFCDAASMPLRSRPHVLHVLAEELACSRTRSARRSTTRRWCL